VRAIALIHFKASMSAESPAGGPLPAMEPPFDVLLSHNSEDKPTVREICRALRERGLRPWLDEEDLIPGRDWQEEIERVLTTIPVVAVLVRTG
jgi:TIR domain-containing protein